MPTCSGLQCSSKSQQLPELVIAVQQVLLLVGQTGHRPRTHAGLKAAQGCVGERAPQHPGKKTSQRCCLEPTCSGSRWPLPILHWALAGCQPGLQIGSTLEIKQRLSQCFQLRQRQGADPSFLAGGVATAAAAQLAQGDLKLASF